MSRKKKVTEKPMTLSLRDAKAGNDIQMIPADNVDAEGTAWATVGENIRKGKNGSGGGGDATITKETIANFYNSLTGGDWRVADMTFSFNSGSGSDPSVEYHDTDYSDQIWVLASGVTCKSGIMGSPIYLGTTDPMNRKLFDSREPMFYVTLKRGEGNMMVYGSGNLAGEVPVRVLLPFQYAVSE